MCAEHEGYRVLRVRAGAGAVRRRGAAGAGAGRRGHQAIPQRHRQGQRKTSRCHILPTHSFFFACFVPCRSSDRIPSPRVSSPPSDDRCATTPPPSARKQTDVTLENLTLRIYRVNLAPFHRRRRISAYFAREFPIGRCVSAKVDGLVVVVLF